MSRPDRREPPEVMTQWRGLTLSLVARARPLDAQPGWLTGAQQHAMSLNVWDDLRLRDDHDNSSARERPTVRSCRSPFQNLLSTPSVPATANTSNLLGEKKSCCPFDSQGRQYCKYSYTVSYGCSCSWMDIRNTGNFCLITVSPCSESLPRLAS